MYKEISLVQAEGGHVNVLSVNCLTIPNEHRFFVASIPIYALWSATMKFIQKVLFAGTLVGLTLPVHSTDKNGSSIGGGGIGAVTCPDIVELVTNANAKGLRSPEYVNDTQGMSMFIEGFRTAYNIHVDDTYDIFHGYDYIQLVQWASNWCRENPLALFRDSVIALSIELYATRLKSSPD